MKRAQTSVPTLFAASSFLESQRLHTTLQSSDTDQAKSWLYTPSSS